KTIVKHPESGAEHGCGLLLAAAAGRPRQGDARSPIAAIVNIGLRFIPQPEAECEIRPRFPVIANEQARVALAAGDSWNSCGNTELAGAPAERAYLGRRVSQLLKPQGSLISLNRLDLDQRRLARGVLYGTEIGVELRSQPAREGKNPVVVLRRNRIDALDPRPNSEFDDVAAVNHGGVILKLVVVLHIESMPRLRAAAVERSQNLNGGADEVRNRFVEASCVLETRFIDCCAKYRGFGGLKSVTGVLKAVCSREQVEAADARIPDVALRICVAHGQSVLRVELIVHPRANQYAALRGDGHGREGRHRQGLRFE